MTDNTNAKMLAMQKEHGPLLEVKDLAIDFTTDTGKPVHAVRDANFTVYPGHRGRIRLRQIHLRHGCAGPAARHRSRGQRLHQA